VSSGTWPSATTPITRRADIRTGFRELVEAFEVLSDPEAPGALRREVNAERNPARLAGVRPESALNDVDTDRHIRASLLAILYTAREPMRKSPASARSISSDCSAAPRPT